MTYPTDEEEVVRRTDERELDRDAFERIRDRIESGLDWGVGALVERDGRVLLVHQDGQWMLPGGGVEPGESHEEALVREVSEEMGLDATPGDLRSVTEQTFVHAGDRATFRFAIYDATVEGELTDDPGLAEENVVAVDWFETLPDNALDRALLRQLLGRD